MEKILTFPHSSKVDCSTKYLEKICQRCGSSKYVYVNLFTGEIFLDTTPNVYAFLKVLEASVWNSLYTPIKWL